MSLRAGTEEVGCSRVWRGWGWSCVMPSGTPGKTELRQPVGRRLPDKRARTEHGPGAPTLMIARCLGATVLALSALPALCGPQSDPLNSAACKNARSELDAALGQASPGVRLARARAQAAAACLGRSDERAVRSGAPDPPQRISPTVIAEPPRAPALPACGRTGAGNRCAEADRHHDLRPRGLLGQRRPPAEQHGARADGPARRVHRAGRPGELSVTGTAVNTSGHRPTPAVNTAYTTTTPGARSMDPCGPSCLPTGRRQR